MKKFAFFMIFVCFSLFASWTFAQTPLGHGSATSITSLDGDGNGTFMGTFTDEGTAGSGHPWYTFTATNGQTVTINLSSDVESYIWVFDVVDNNAQIGDATGADIIAAGDTGGSMANTLAFVAPSSGQFVIQVDSFFGAATVNYTLIISGASGGPTLPIPTLEVWAMVLMGGLLLLVVYRQRKKARM